MAEDFTPPVIESKLGVMSTSRTGWKLELNFVSWGGRPAKYDLRSWDPKHEKMGKGVTLTEDEARELYRLLGEVFAE